MRHRILFAWIRVCPCSVPKGAPFTVGRSCARLLSEVAKLIFFAKRPGKESPPPDLSGVVVHRIGGKLDRDPDTRERQLISLNEELHRELESAGPFDLVYERFSLWSYAAMRYAKQGDMQSVLEVNSPLIEEQKTYRTLINEELAFGCREKCISAATSVIAVSDQVADQFLDLPFGTEKITTVCNGVNVERFDRLLQEGLLEDRDTTPLQHPGPKKIVVGFVGTLKPWHGVDILIDAFAAAWQSNPGLHLRIVGDGPERESLNNKVAAFDEDIRNSIEWLGTVANWEMPGVLSTLDIAVAPYPQLEGFYFSPLKILEYMAAGLPIIASKIGQIPQLLTHEQTGLLPTAGCANELTQSILRLCDDGSLRNKLGESACQLVRQHHSWHIVVDRILDTLPATLIPASSNSAHAPRSISSRRVCR